MTPEVKELVRTCGEFIAAYTSYLDSETEDLPDHMDMWEALDALKRTESRAVTSEALDLASIPREDLEAFYRAHNHER